MGRVLTQNVSLRYVVESALAVAPTTGWRLLEPNTIGAFGAEIKTVSREPITKNRLEREGSTVDLDSKVEFTSDMTMDHIVDFLEGFLFCKYYAPTGSLTDGAPFLPTAVTATGYTVASGGALTAGTLIFAQGFATAANNGLKVVTSGSTATEIHASGLTAETGTAARFATVTICGRQGAAGDITINASGHIASTALDFTTLGLRVGQFIYVPGGADATSFTTCPAHFARITAITATLISTDMRTATAVADTAAAKTINLYFGRYVKNVDKDDAQFLERSYHFEMTWPNLQVPGPGDEYEYAKGNYANEMTINVPLTDKATVTWGFVGTDTAAPVTARQTGPSTASTPIMEQPFNTSTDLAWLRIAETDGTSRAAYFKTLEVKIMNNVTPEKVLGTLGAAFMNYGKFKVRINAQVLFTDSQITAAIRANRTMTFNFAVKNEEGGIFFSMPSVKLGGGKRDFPENETVTLQTEAMAFQDAVMGVAMSASLFPYLP